MFRTVVNPEISAQKIELNHSVLALGSCFAQHIGRKLADYKFAVNVNPFGTLFNPHSIFKLINMAAVNEILGSVGIVKTQGVFHHYDLHSDLSNINKEDLLENANEKLRLIGRRLHETDVIIYTLGTAIVYELKESGEIVANCHKIPADQFIKRFLEIDEIIQGFKVNYNLLKSVNRKARFILTVSPVRHYKDSFEKNNVSKSLLRIACEKIKDTFADVEYFPAFEIMTDDLRDYRFYAEDMLHPSAAATEYIWQKFREVYFSEETKEFILKWQKVLKALAHRPFNRTSDQHQLFIQKTIILLKEFKDKTDIRTELDYLKAQLK